MGHDNNTWKCKNVESEKKLLYFIKLCQNYFVIFAVLEHNVVISS